jgi:hypothetical protein
MHTSLKIAQSLEYFLHDTALVLPFIPLSRAQTSARNTSTELYLVRFAIHNRDPS